MKKKRQKKNRPVTIHKECAGHVAEEHGFFSTQRNAELGDAIMG